MNPVGALRPSDARSLRFIFTDIDDTLTRDGMLSREAFAALWKLHHAGLSVVPVTGRPAGWCDCIVRQWPVDAVVGENGAFVLYREADSISELVHPAVASPEHRGRLDAVRDEVLRRVPGARIAKDQRYRLFDLAIDFREDPPYLDFNVAQEIADICRGMGAEAKISSIHVNAWYGSYDKLTMVVMFLEQKYGLDVDEMKRVAAFCGDSPNDEPMFSFFPLSCGVSNLAETIDMLEQTPGYITQADHGAGFAEFVSAILQKR